MLQTRRTIALPALLIGLALFTSGCPQAVAPDGGTDGGRGPDATTMDTAAMPDVPIGDTAATCESAVAELRAYIQSSQTCTTAADCEQVGAGCFPEQQDCCVVYLARTRDAARWSALYGAVMSRCSAGGCGCCAAIPAPAGCVAGRCAPMR